MRIAVAGDPPCDLAPVRAAIRRAARPYGLPKDASVDLVFVTDPHMRELNRRFRGIDRTTDVLSFGEPIPADRRGRRAVSIVEGRRPLVGGRFEAGENGVFLVSVEATGTKSGLSGPGSLIIDVRCADTTPAVTQPVITSVSDPDNITVPGEIFRDETVTVATTASELPIS